MSSTLDWAWYALAALLAAGGVALGAVALFRDRSRGRRRCPKCWYSMEGVPGTVCPECGKDAGREKRLFKTRRYWWRGATAFLLGVLAWVAAGVPGVVSGGWAKLVPSTVLVEVAPVDRSQLGVASGAVNGSLSIMEQLHEEVLERARNGQFWRWQSQRFFDRTYGGTEAPFRVRTPQRWLRGEALPLDCLEWFERELEINYAGGEWVAIGGARVEPPLTPVVRLPVRRLMNSHIVYEGVQVVRVGVVDSIDQLFDVVTGPEADARIRRLVRVKLQGAGGNWAVLCESLPQPDPPEEPWIVARLNVAVRLDDRVVGTAIGCARSSWAGERFEFSCRVAWTGEEPSSEDVGRATRRITNDLDASAREWSHGVAGTPHWLHGPPTTWVGTLDWPAIPGGAAP